MSCPMEVASLWIGAARLVMAGRREEAWLAMPFAPFCIADAAAVAAGSTIEVRSPARLVARGTTALVTRPPRDVAAFSRAGTAKEMACLTALVWFVRQEEMLVKKPCTEEFPA